MTYTIELTEQELDQLCDELQDFNDEDLAGQISAKLYKARSAK